jgi:hypothetical protein
MCALPFLEYIQVANTGILCEESCSACHDEVF